MFRFIFQKLLNKKWMLLSLLIGNILIVAIASANPMYSQAVMQRTLTDALSDYLVTENKHPGLIQVKNSFIPRSTARTYENIEKTEDLMKELLKKMKVSTTANVRHYYCDNVRGLPEVVVDGDSDSLSLNIGSYSDIEEHIELVHGRLYDNEMKDLTIEVIVSERTLEEQNLTLGSIIRMAGWQDEWLNLYQLEVVGVFKEAEGTEGYWASSVASWRNVCIMSEDIFKEMIANLDNKEKGFTLDLYTILDYQKMKPDQTGDILNLLNTYEVTFNTVPVDSIEMNCRETLEAFIPKMEQLQTTITVLQVPIFTLLFAFIFMVSRQMLELEQNEIAVFKSRGAARSQLILIYLLQSTIVGGIGLLGGIPLGRFVCRLLGASNAFLEFVNRTGLVVEMGVKAWMFALGAAFLSMAAMVLPVFQYASVTIVDHKRQQNRAIKRSWWQWTFVDIILLGVSIYGWYQYKGEEEYLAQRLLEGAGLDPMLYLYSSLFMLGAGLLILRVLPWAVRLVFWIGKKFWQPAMYASFLRMLRSRSNQGFMVVFLVLTVAMGIYSTRTARSINANAEDQIRYLAGADVVLQEQWRAKSSGTYIEPDFHKYEKMEGVLSAAKVFVDQNVYTVAANGRGKILNTTLMGINTKDFGETAWFRESLMETDWYNYLNLISQDTQAILISSNMGESCGYKVGDTLVYFNGNNEKCTGMIYGMVDYWPSYVDASWSRGTDGVYKEEEQYLIVAHLSQLQAEWGIQPYQVWLDVEDSTQFLYDYIEESGTEYTLFQDTLKLIVEYKNDPMFQGTNGILTIGFIIILVLCAVGFLIYWILSMQSRTLQFGIFRAMGMSRKEIWSMLLNEQFFISGLAIVGGIAVGQSTADMFVPLIQVAYSSAQRVIPLEIISQGSDYVRLGVVIGLMIVCCLVVLGVLTSKIRIAEALKLGED
ncbi:MAG: ABC transporter permease [Firmicutes bacterium]|nr:ABC transporter permease [Bacillota bacterium]